MQKLRLDLRMGLLTAWLVAATCLTAQEAPLDHLRVMVFQPLSIDDASAANPADETTASLIGQAVLNAVKSENAEIIQAPGWSDLRTADFVAGTEISLILDRARQAGAQAAVAVSWFREGRRISLIGKVYDVWSARLLAGATRTGLDDLGLLNLTDEMTKELLGKLDAAAAGLIAAWGTTTIDGISQGLVLRSPDEGAIISLGATEELGIIHNGVLFLPFRPLALKQDITVTIARPGFYTRQYQFQAKDTAAEVSLPGLYPRSKWSFMAGIDPLMVFNSKNSNQAAQILGLGAGLRYLPLDEAWYIQFWYLFKEPRSNAVVSGVTPPTWFMHDLSVTAAVALMPPDWIFRLFIGAGLGAYLTAAGTSGTATFFDPYIELPAIDIQLNFHPIIIDFEFGSQFVFDVGSNLLPQGLVRSTGLLHMGVGFKW